MKCYDSCLTCFNIESPKGYHNCEKCKNGYQFYSSSSLPSNCYPKTVNGFKFYIDTDDKYIPLGEKSPCPSSHPYLIDSTGECTINCKVDSQGFYKKTNNANNDMYELKKMCFASCPIGSNLSFGSYNCESLNQFYCRGVEFIVDFENGGESIASYKKTYEIIYSFASIFD